MLQPGYIEPLIRKTKTAGLFCPLLEGKLNRNKLREGVNPARQMVAALVLAQPEERK